MRLSIRQPLALCALHSFQRTVLIVHAEADAIVIPKIKLSQITVQVLFFAVLIGATHAALEQAEITLNRVV